MSPLLSVLVLAIVLGGFNSFAATFTWTNLNGGNASGSWANGANWSGATLPTTTNDTASFTNLDVTADSTVTLDGNQVISALTFGDAAGSSGANWLLHPGSPTNSTLTLGGATPRIMVSGLGSGKSAIISAKE